MPRLILIPFLSLLLAACGQTGPLYLPKDAPDKTSSAVSAPIDEPTGDEVAPQQPEGR